MALIKCPECGKEVSENAISCPNCGEPISKKPQYSADISGEIDSGTETFTITAGNRLSLSTSTQAKIKSVTEQLSAQGKNVTSVNTSVPQPISVGVTTWQNDVTIVWQASLNSPKYKEYLYSQAKSLMSKQQYPGAKEIFTKLGDYQDSRNMAKECSNEWSLHRDEIKKKEDKKAWLSCLGFIGACAAVVIAALLFWNWVNANSR